MDGRLNGLEGNISKLESQKADLQKENSGLIVKVRDLEEQINALQHRILQQSQETEAAIKRAADGDASGTNSSAGISKQAALISSVVARPLSPGAPEVVFVLETGAWRIRAGWVYADHLAAMDFPCLLAR